jgi:hypothetical protein
MKIITKIIKWTLLSFGALFFGMFLLAFIGISSSKEGTERSTTTAPAEAEAPKLKPEPVKAEAPKPTPAPAIAKSEEKLDPMRAKPTEKDFVMAREWSRQQARGLLQRRVSKSSGMRVDAFAKFTADEEFPNNPKMQRWFIGYVLPLTEAIAIWAEKNILDVHEGLTKWNVFEFFAILSDHPSDLKGIAEAIGLEGAQAEPEPEVRKAVAVEKQPKPVRRAVAVK